MKTIVTITGPSASGKTTLEAALIEGYSSVHTRIRSHTTRPMRPGDAHDGYHWVTPEVFDKTEMIESVSFAGNQYGVSADEIRIAAESNKMPIVVVEPLGRRQIEQWCKKNDYRHFMIFIDAPLELRMSRMTERFVADLALRLGRYDGEAGKLIKSFSSRLSIAATLERQWKNEAVAYQLRILDFNAENKARVVRSVADAIYAFDIAPERAD